MAEITVNTADMRERGKMISDLTNELRVRIDSFFDRLEKVPTVTKEWTGPAALRYSELAKNDKNEYVTFKDELMSEGMFLVSQADAIEQEINSLRRG